MLSVVDLPAKRTGGMTAAAVFLYLAFTGRDEALLGKGEQGRAGVAAQVDAVALGLVSFDPGADLELVDRSDDSVSLGNLEIEEVLGVFGILAGMDYVLRIADLYGEGRLRQGIRYFLSACRESG